MNISDKVARTIFLLLGKAAQDQNDSLVAVENALDEVGPRDYGEWQRDIVAAARLFRRYPGFYPDQWATWEEVRAEFVDGLGLYDPEADAPRPRMVKKDDIKWDGELLQVMVDVLKSPYAKNVLGRDLLTKLRKALLDPEELAQVKDNMAKFYCCRNCGSELMDYEVGTFRRDPAPAGQDTEGSILCFKCQPGVKVKCQTPDCEVRLMVNLPEIHCQAHGQPNVDVAGGAYRPLDLNQVLMDHLAPPRRQR